MKDFVKILAVLFLVSGGVILPGKLGAKRLYKKVVVVKNKKYSGYPDKGTHVLFVRSAKRVRYNKGVFYISNGIFYKKSTRGYKVVAAPVGIRVKVLPAKHVRVVQSSCTYFYHYGTYYMAVGKKYEVVLPSTGIRVDELPGGYKKITKNGKEFYFLDGVYYKRVFLKNGTMAFEVVRMA